MSDVRNLYSTIIKYHNETPFHYAKIYDAQNTIKAYNPICGDRFELYIDCLENIITRLHFYGFGCAISKASASVLVKSVEGKSLSEAVAICDLFLRFLDRELNNNELILSGEFIAFSGVHDFPERYECAALSWKEVKKFLEHLNKSEK